MTNPSENTQQQLDPQTAHVKQTVTLISAIWLIPLMAAIVGAWLLAQNLRTKGPEIKLLMDNAEGIEVNTTAVRILNVDVGRVTNIRLRDDQKGVEITARLNKDVEDLMREDTQFWIVKPRIDQNGITGLGTLVSGSYIAFSPGTSLQEKHEFTVSDLPPVTAIGQSGLRLHLSGKNSKMVSVGSPILFENHVVGTVESAKFDPEKQQVQYSIFIHSPNESLLSPETLFWVDSGISVQTDGAGIQVNTPPFSALLSGAISFHTPPFELAERKSIQNGDEFTIYNNRKEVESREFPNTLFYVAFFNQSVRGLEVGAPVEYRGLKIGSVANVPYFADGEALKLFRDGMIPVRIRIDPYLIEMGGQTHESREYWENELQVALQRGLTAQLSSNNLILGSKMIELSDEKSSLPIIKPVNEYHHLPVMASRSGGSLENLQAQMGQLLEKFNKLPLENTVGELNGNLKELRTSLQAAQKLMSSMNQTMNSANKLISKPQTQQIPNEINQVLRELRETLQGVSPQSPVYQDVQNTLREVDEVLRDAKPLIRTLKDKPNSLIFNSNHQDPIPKGSPEK